MLSLCILLKINLVVRWVLDFLQDNLSNLTCFRVHRILLILWHFNNLFNSS